MKEARGFKSQFFFLCCACSCPGKNQRVIQAGITIGSQARASEIVQEGRDLRFRIEMRLKEEKRGGKNGEA